MPSETLRFTSSFVGSAHMLSITTYATTKSNTRSLITTMATLKYKVIKSKSQYRKYSRMLAKLVSRDLRTKTTRDEIDLLTLLIGKWDDDHNRFDEVDPITLLHSLMEDKNLKAKDLVELLGVSKGLVSDILNYKKGLSKENIRSLAKYFKVSQEAFNRFYRLVPTKKLTSSLHKKK